MKKVYFVLVASILLFSSCNWNLADSGDLSDVTVSTVVQTMASVEKSSCYHNSVLNSYEIRYIGDTTTRRIDQIQQYTAAGALSGAWYYIRNTAGLVEVAAYYTSDSKLSFYDAYTYDSGNLVTGQYEYDSAGALKWARLYSTVASGTAKGQLDSAVHYTGPVASPVLDGGLKYYFLSTSATWNVEIAYGTESSSLSAGVTASNPTALTVDGSSFTYETKLALDVPSTPTVPSNLTIPSDISAASLAVSGYRFSLDDTYGNTKLSFDRNWYPSSGIRIDSRIAKAVTVNLTHDSAGRITSKSSLYGSLVALKVDVTYENATSWFPVSVATSGNAMLIPLSYAIEYDSSNHAVKTVRVSSNGTTIRILKYTYASALSAQTLSASKNMDPFAFLDAILKSGVTIADYDGDNNLQETFTTALTTSGSAVTGVVVTVTDKNGTKTGSYEVGFDSAGLCASIVAKSADGTIAWTQSTTSLTDTWSSLTHVASTSLSGASGFGTMIESYIPSSGTSASSSDVIKGIQENFVYSLLF